MPIGNPHVGDVGTEWRITVYQNINQVLSIVDLSSANFDTYKLQFRDGNNLVLTPVVASLFSTGPSGIIHYINNSNPAFLYVSGTWGVRAVISNSISGVIYTGSFFEFPVDA